MLENLLDFLNMGGYAAFVWPPYVIAALVMAGIAITSWRQLRASERTLRELEAARPPRQSGGQKPGDGNDA